MNFIVVVPTRGKFNRLWAITNAMKRMSNFLAHFRRKFPNTTCDSCKGSGTTGDLGKACCGRCIGTGLSPEPFTLYWAETAADHQGLTKKHFGMEEDIHLELRDDYFALYSTLGKPKKNFEHCSESTPVFFRWLNNKNVMPF